MKQQPQGKEESVRSFICIDIPRTIKLQMEELQAALRTMKAQVSWVNPSNIHLTIKFLGNVPASRIQVVCSGVAKAARAVNPFHVQVAGAGAFPSARSPRVLWVGLATPSPELLALYQGVEDEMARAGFERESRAFSPHLTIGRLRSRDNASRLGELITATGFPPNGFEASEVIVMRSTLKPTGAIYTPLEIVPLGSPT